ncbi:hypothetical protein RT21_04165 [Pseudomonas sp. 10B238]|nr:hypothetical protein RT21_04165 [Pseudomonas sp. 10B238]
MVGPLLEAIKHQGAGMDMTRRSWRLPSAWYSQPLLIRLGPFLSGCLEAKAEIGKFRIPLNLIRLRPA